MVGLGPTIHEFPWAIPFTSWMVVTSTTMTKKAGLKKTGLYAFFSFCAESTSMILGTYQSPWPLLLAARKVW
jgi:hypothetical protein